MEIKQIELEKEHIEIIISLLDNEIKSNISFIDDVKGDEKEFWKNFNVDLRKIKKVLKK